MVNIVPYLIRTVRRAVGIDHLLRQWREAGLAGASRTNEERNGKRNNHDADKHQPNNGEYLSEDATSIHMRLIGVWQA